MIDREILFDYNVNRLLREQQHRDSEARRQADEARRARKRQRGK